MMAIYGDADTEEERTMWELIVAAAVLIALGVLGLRAYRAHERRKALRGEK